MSKACMTAPRAGVPVQREALPLNGQAQAKPGDAAPTPEGESRHAPQSSRFYRQVGVPHLAGEVSGASGVLE